MLTFFVIGLQAAAIFAKPTPQHTPVHELVRRDDGIVNIPGPVNHTGNVDACAGYALAVSRADDTGIDGTLTLKGTCNAFGPDYETLKLTVRYENADRVRVHITDAEGKAHVVPDDVVPTKGAWPVIGDASISADDCNLKFDYVEDPFSFKISRKSDGEMIFDTTGQALIFEEQYVRVKSALADGTNIQGLAQHNDNFTLPIEQPNYVRTFWTRDAYGIPPQTNLYGVHKFFVNQKVGDNPSASGVFMLSSQGLDIKFPEEGKYIEYNSIGGVADFFFFNGPQPVDVVRQGVSIWGASNEVPYWSLGYHSCRYGYQDIFDVAETVANYSAAGIPLQTQWMDIDYMHDRWINTLDDDRFALEKVRYVVDGLTSRDQNFIVMVDPAVFSGTPNQSVVDYETLQSGLEADIFMHMTDGELYQGVVWPGPTAFPDWTHPKAQDWWNSEFLRFFDAEKGVNVSGIWLDMNEPANFLPYLEANIYRIAEERGSPPVRPLPRIIPRTIDEFPMFIEGRNISMPLGNGGGGDHTSLSRRSSKRMSAPVRELKRRQAVKYPEYPATMDDFLSPMLDNQWLYPPYQIDHRRAPPSTNSPEASLAGRANISDFSARTDVVQANGARQYDEHNLYGSRHAIRTHNALANRTPGKRPFTIARSSFSGTPSSLWLGDNLSTWEQYIGTIRMMLQFAAVSGVGVVGADTCGFGGNTTETLCARWAWLGAFNTFYRNHYQDNAIPQEFYRWNLTTIAGRAAGRTRLALLDYTYTNMMKASADGTPTLWPLSWVHPTEAETVHIESQFYYGPNLLISPVTVENSTSVEFYLPNDIFYDYFTYKPVDGQGSRITLDNVGYDTMPVHILGGAVIPLRVGESMTTNENRQLPFRLVVAPGRDGCAEGQLYLDDGESIDVGDAYSDIHFKFDGGSCLKIGGKFGYPGDECTKAIDSIVFLNQDCAKSVMVNGKKCGEACFDAEAKTITVKNLGISLDCESLVTLE